MVEPNLESLIRDLYNHARHDLSEDLVVALLETAKNYLLQMSNCWQSVSQGWSIVNYSRIPDIRHLELLNLARFIKREEAKYRGTAASALMYGELFKNALIPL